MSSLRELLSAVGKVQAGAPRQSLGQRRGVGHGVAGVVPGLGKNSTPQPLQGHGSSFHWHVGQSEWDDIHKVAGLSQACHTTLLLTHTLVYWEPLVPMLCQPTEALAGLCPMPDGWLCVVRDRSRVHVFVVIICFFRWVKGSHKEFIHLIFKVWTVSPRPETVVQAACSACSLYCGSTVPAFAEQEAIRAFTLLESLT